MKSLLSWLPLGYQERPGKGHGGLCWNAVSLTVAGWNLGFAVSQTELGLKLGASADLCLHAGGRKRPNLKTLPLALSDDHSRPSWAQNDPWVMTFAKAEVSGL